MARITDAGKVLFGAYVDFQYARHTFKIGNHGFDLLDSLAGGFDADLPQAIEPLATFPIATPSLAVIGRGLRQSGKFLQY